MSVPLALSKTSKIAVPVFVNEIGAFPTPKRIRIRYFLVYVISIIFISFPSLPGACISNTSVVGLVHLVVMRYFTILFVTGSIMPAWNVQAWFASHVPVVIMMPVPMLSDQVDHHFFVVLS